MSDGTVKSIIEKDGVDKARDNLIGLLDTVNIRIYNKAVLGMENETYIGDIELYSSVQQALMNILRALNSI